MKIGINRWTFPSDWTIERCFQLAKDSGFDSIEINIAEDDYLTPNSTEAETKALLSLATSIGLED